MAGLKALFNIGRIERAIDAWREEREDGIVDALKYTGEEFVNKARDTRTYKDRTANLRSSIGYGVYKNGKREELNLEGTQTGRRNAVDTLEERVTGASYELIGAAGMEYAAAVEAKGYDVITGSAPSRNQILKNINEINN